MTVNVAGPSAHETELLLSKEESLIPPGLPLLKEQAADVAAGRLAIAEIAGRDSVAALLAAVEDGHLEAVIPTAVYTGTEYGDWSVLFGTVEKLREALARTSTRLIGDLQLLGSPRLWAALNGRYMRRLSREFGFCAPCIGCHLYVHLVRVPLAWAVGAGNIVSGERESHDGRVKINQTGAALDAYSRVLRSADLELSLPIRSMASGADVEALAGAGWEEGDRQLRCVLSKNYEDSDGTVSIRDEAMGDFLEHFVVPVGKAVVEAWRVSDSVDFDSAVASILSVREGTS